MDARDLSHGGYRDYSVSQGLQEELNASYVAFNDDGVPIKTFFHAKTFNGQHSRLKKKHTGHLGKEATGLVKQVSISTEEETPIKQFQSLRMMSLPVQETCERKATLMARVDEENSSVHESVLLAGRGRYEDAGLEAVEFNRESFKFVRLNKSLDPPSLKNNPKDIHLEALLSPSSQILSPNGDSPIQFNQDEVKVGFSTYSSTVHFPTIQSPIFIGLPLKSSLANSLSWFKRPEEEHDQKTHIAEEDLSVTGMLFSHKDIQKWANSDMELPSSIQNRSRKPPTFKQSGNFTKYANEVMANRPKSTTLVDFEGLTKACSKLPASSTINSSMQASFRPLKQKDFCPRANSRDYLSKSKNKQLPKWASHENLGEASINRGEQFVLISPGNRPKKNYPKLMELINSPKNLTILKQHKSQVHFGFQSNLTENPPRIQLSKNKSGSNSRALFRNTVPKVQSNFNFSRSYTSSPPVHHRFLVNSQDSTAEDPLSHQSFIPRALDLITDKTPFELIVKIKEILLSHDLDPYVVGTCYQNSSAIECQCSKLSLKAKVEELNGVRTLNLTAEAHAGHSQLLESIQHSIALIFAD